MAGDKIDNEIGDMIGERGLGNSNLFTDVRYNAELSRDGLDELGLQRISEKDQMMDSVKHIDKLQAMEKAIAFLKVQEDHFKYFLKQKNS